MPERGLNLIVVLTCILPLAGCSSSGGGGKGKPRVVLGSIMADDVDELSRSELYAVRMAVDEINASEAFEFELEVANLSPARGDFVDPEKAAENVRLLYDEHEAVAYVAGHGADSSLAMNEVTNQDAYADFVRCANTASEATSNLPGMVMADETDTFYRNVVTISVHMDLGVKVFLEHGWTKIGLYRLNDNSGMEVSLGVQQKIDEYSRYGFTLAFDRAMEPGSFVLEDNIDTLDEIIEFSNNDEVDVMVLGLLQAQTNGVIKYLTENDYTAAIIISTASTTNELFDIATGIGDWMQQGEDNLIIGVEPDCYTGENADVFMQAFESRFDQENKPYDATAYDCVYTLALALSYAGEDNRTAAGIWEHMRKFKEQNRSDQEVEVGFGAAEFARAVDLIEQGGRVDYHGVSGPQVFDENGDRPAQCMRTFGPNASGTGWEVVDHYDEELNKIEE